MAELTNTPDNPATIEVAVRPGIVSINYISLVDAGQWGHLSFTPEQADALIEALQQARIQAALQRN